MKNKIEELLKQLEQFEPKVADDVEQMRIKLLGRKGELNALMEEFKGVSSEMKRELGQQLNNLKKSATDRINELKVSFESGIAGAGSASGANGMAAGAAGVSDMSRPAAQLPVGSRHPISIVKNRIVELFGRLGYAVADGPEIEDDWHVFSALNFPPEHPARDMQDTFFIQSSPDILLRTHTSSIQVRTMEREDPPIRVICPGRVFRNEAISYRAHCIFHQIEGLYIDEDVSFADMKQSILFFAKEIFGESATIRMRPSYFPFTEPSAEVDVSCNLCGGKGCNVCKGTGWLEIMGCGMVDPNVLESNGIDSKKYSGFAFGMGVERIAMLLYGVKDLRLYFENDVRFLKQFDKAL
ncbi:MAG: phenylalanine--tRNA ligase subunit alpha [Rikenellaceae bacterium]